MPAYLINLDDHRETVRILGNSVLPSAGTIRQIGAGATYESSFLKVLMDLPNSTVRRLRDTLASGTGGLGFLRGVEDIAFGPKVGGWLRVDPLSAVASARLDVLLRCAAACQHAPAPNVIAAAEAIAGVNEAPGDEDIVAVSVFAAALDYAERNGAACAPVPDAPFVRYARNNRESFEEIASIIREHGWDVDLIGLMRETQTSLRDGVL